MLDPRWPEIEAAVRQWRAAVWQRLLPALEQKGAEASRAWWSVWLYGRCRELEMECLTRPGGAAFIRAALDRWKRAPLRQIAAPRGVEAQPQRGQHRLRRGSSWLRRGSRIASS